VLRAAAATLGWACAACAPAPCAMPRPAPHTCARSRLGLA
jgi:hypothetical protein